MGATFCKLLHLGRGRICTLQLLKLSLAEARKLSRLQLQATLQCKHNPTWKLKRTDLMQKYITPAGVAWQGPAIIKGKFVRLSTAGADA